MNKPPASGAAWLAGWIAGLPATSASCCIRPSMSCCTCMIELIGCFLRGSEIQLDALLTHGIEAVTQRARGHAKAGGGLGLVPVGLANGVDHMLVLGPLAAGTQGRLAAFGKRHWWLLLLLFSHRRYSQPQILRLDEQAVAQHQCTLHGVFQLAGIARPVVLQQCATGLGGQQ